MSALIDDPLVRGVALPFLAALVAALVLRSLGAGPARWASAGVPAAFLAVYLLLLGTPPFPPVSAAQKIPYAVAGLTLLGIVLDGRGLRGLTGIFAGMLALAAAIGWLAMRPLSAGGQTAWTNAALVVAAGCAAFLALHRDRGRPAVACAALAAAALGFAGVALAGASASLAQAAIALAAAAGGFAVLNWFRPLAAFGHAGTVGAAGALALLAGQAAFFSRLDRVALLLLAACIPMLFVMGRIGIGRGGGMLAPVAAGFAAGVPAAAAVAVAWFANRPGGY